MTALSIAARAEQWWQQHGGKHDSPEWNAFLANVAAKIPLKLQELSEEHTNNGRFGMSNAGGCTRQSSLKLLGYEKEELSGSTRFTFMLGHLIEVVGGICTLEALGYPVRGLQEKVRIDPFMESATDGIFDLDGVPTILSVKSAGYKMSGFDKRSGTWRRYGFAQYPTDGVLGTTPKYYAQSQMEMRAANISQSLTFVVAKDIIKAMEGDPKMKENGSTTFYAELIPYNPSHAQRIHEVWQRQWSAILKSEAGPAMVFTKNAEWVELTPADTGKDSPNKALTGSFNFCDYCDLVASCKKALNVRRTA